MICKCLYNIFQAEQRAREESERLRQQEREQIAEKRRRDLVCCLSKLSCCTFVGEALK